MIPQRGIFKEYEEYQNTIYTAAGQLLQVIGRGLISITQESNGKEITIAGVLHVLGLAANLISIRQLTERGIKCSFTVVVATIMRKKATLAVIPKEGDSYILYTRGESAYTVLPSKALWHKRLGHASTERL